MPAGDGPTDLWSALPIGAFLADPDGILREVNDALRKAVRRPGEALVGESLVGVFGVAFAEVLSRADGEPHASLEAALGPETDAPWLRVHLRRTADGLVGAVYDVTEEVGRRHRRSRVAAWSRELHQVSSFERLFDLVEREVAQFTRYRSVSLFVITEPGSTKARLLAARGRRRSRKWEMIPTIDAATDDLGRALLEADRPIVIPDARLDPRTDKRIVAALENRTIVVIPMVLLDERVGVLHTGTYGEEGVLPPTAVELEYLESMAAQIAVAAGRLRLLERERVAEEARRELERQLARADKLESLGLLAGGIAHDVNNLMTAVLGNLSLALDQLPEGSEVGEKLERALAAADRTTGLATKMLAYAGDGVVAFEEADMVGLTREVVSRRADVPADVALEVTAEDEVLVKGDPAQLRQMVLSLVTNATEAMAGRVGTVHVALRCERLAPGGLVGGPLPGPDEEGEYAILEVQDEGVGVDEASRDRLFNPFFTTKGPGRGLGLSVVLGIAQSHGGAIAVRSSVASGTCVVVALPIATPAVRSLPPPEAGRTVLVVDDEEMLRTLARNVLEQEGMVVLEACDGIDAQEVVRAHRDDIGAVLLDVRMPRMSGVAFLDWLAGEGIDVPVVITSGHTGEGDPIHDRADAYLPKPYRPAALVDAILALRPRG